MISDIFVIFIFCFQLLESIWNFLKGNISFAFNLVTTVLSIVFFSGAYLLNTGLSMVSFVQVIAYYEIIILWCYKVFICKFMMISMPVILYM